MQISHEFITENADKWKFSALIEKCYLEGEVKEGVGAEDIVALWQENEDLWAEVTLHKLFKVEDVYKDGKTRVETIRKGKGRKPYVDSTVYCKYNPQNSNFFVIVYLRIQLN